MIALGLPKFSSAQWKGLATILSDIGQILFATVIVPVLFRLDGVDSPSVLFGTLVMLVCWAESLVFLREVDRT